MTDPVSLPSFHCMHLTLCNTFWTLHRAISSSVEALEKRHDHVTKAEQCLWANTDRIYLLLEWNMECTVPLFRLSITVQISSLFFGDMVPLCLAIGAPNFRESCLSASETNSIPQKNGDLVRWYSWDRCPGCSGNCMDRVNS